MFITLAAPLPMTNKRRQNLSSGLRRILPRKISIYLQRHLLSKFVQPSDVLCFQVVIGGDQSNTAFQFDMSVLVEIANNCIINFKVVVHELICRKNTERLLEETILPRLTARLEIISTFQLQIFRDNKGGTLVVEYHRHGQILNTTPRHIPTTKVFVMGNLAFQAMALGKESMAGHWCMQFKASWLQFTDY